MLIDFVLMDDMPESFRRRVEREGRLPHTTQGAGVGKTVLRGLGGLVRGLGALPRAAKQRMVDLRELASGNIG